MAKSKMYTLGVVFSGKNRISPVLDTITKDTKQATAAAFAYSHATKRMLGAIRGPRLGLGGLIGGGAALYGIQRGIRGIISESSRFEVANVQFEGLLGSAELAKKTLNDLFTFAAQTPFEFRKTQEFAKGLVAAGVNAKELIPTLRMLGDVGLGNPETIERLSYAYSKLRITGKATWRELTMFATAGVPIFEQIRNQMNLSQTELMSAVRSGKVMFSDVETALKSLSGPGGKFNGMMMRMMDTVRGLWSNFSENLDKISVSIGTAINPYVKTLLLEMISLSESVLKLADNNQEAIGERFKGMVAQAIVFVRNLKEGFQKTVKVVAWLARTGLKLLPIFIGIKIGTTILYGLATSVQVVSGVMLLLGKTGVTVGGLMSAAWLPFLLIVLAAVAGAALLYAGLRKIGMLGGDTGGLFGDYQGLFDQVMGSTNLQTPEGRATTSTIENSSSKEVKALIELMAPEGTTASLTGGEDSVSLSSIDTGNQLLSIS